LVGLEGCRFGENDAKNGRITVTARFKVIQSHNFRYLSNALYAASY